MEITYSASSHFDVDWTRAPEPTLFLFPASMDPELKLPGSAFFVLTFNRYKINAPQIRISKFSCIPGPVLNPAPIYMISKTQSLFLSCASFLSAGIISNARLVANSRDLLP